jgi:hypothetical protein
MVIALVLAGCVAPNSGRCEPADPLLNVKRDLIKRADAGVSGPNVVKDKRGGTFVFLMNTVLTDEEKESLRLFSEFTGISLMRTNIRSADLAYLANLKLRDLVLGDTKIDDEAIVHLNRLRELERLEIGSTRVSDKGISALDLPNLTSLQLDDTAVTAIGIRAMKVPSLEIIMVPKGLSVEMLDHFKEFPKLRYVGWNDCKEPKHLKSLNEFLRDRYDRQEKTGAAKQPEAATDSHNKELLRTGDPRTARQFAEP